MADDDQRAQLIRNLDKAACDAASQVAFLSRKYRELVEADDPDMPPRDAVAAENGIEEAMRGASEAKRVLGKLARRLDGPPPSLALRAAVFRRHVVQHDVGEPGHLDIIAREPAGDLIVGYAIRTGTGEDENWRMRLTDRDRARGSIGLCYQATPEDLLEALNRHLDEDGPWWARGERTDG